MKTLITKSHKIQKARRDISQILDRYNITLPEIMGIIPEKDRDRQIWKSIRKDYEKAQKKVFAEKYPDLWKKIKNR